MLVRYLKNIKSICRHPILYSKFILFENSINKNTWNLQKDALVRMSTMVDDDKFNYKNGILNSTNVPISYDVQLLQQKLFRDYYNKYISNDTLRILIHIPSSQHSPGGYSLFNNLLQSLKFVGVKCESLPWDRNVKSYLDTFKPTILLSSDHSSYLSRIDWKAVESYRVKNYLRIGLTASLQEYGNTPLKKRLIWAKNNNIDFYYSFRTTKYHKSRKEYFPFFENGYKIFSVEFGANPLLYYPITGVEKDLNFVFLASSNSDKWKRYFQYMSKILKKYDGLIDGPGWSRINNWLPPHAHKYVYARAKVGLNLHISDSIDYPSELNERTYILAACGVPQLVDNAMLLRERFDLKNLFIAEKPKEYEDLFEYIITHTEVAKEKAKGALKEVYEKHTTVHRADSFIKELLTIINL